MQVYTLQLKTNYLLPALLHVLPKTFMALFAGFIIQFSLHLWVLRLLRAVDYRMMSKRFIDAIINVFV